MVRYESKYRVRQRPVYYMCNFAIPIVHPEKNRKPGKKKSENKARSVDDDINKRLVKGETRNHDKV